ncbi:hypothetical protein PCANC_15161 [Puccinia coronata f. sp. avenae]|nr:hypothetical protein PCANC_15161 [Puccinia coronata f. sp. avenae]
MLLCAVSGTIGEEKWSNGKRLVFRRDDGMPLSGLQRRSSRSTSGTLAKGLSSASRLSPKKMAFKGPSKDIDSGFPSPTKNAARKLPAANDSKADHAPQTDKVPPSNSSTETSSTGEPTVKKHESLKTTPARSSDETTTKKSKDKERKSEEEEPSQPSSSTVSNLFNGAKKAVQTLNKLESSKETDYPGETSPETSTLSNLKHEDPAGLVGEIESQEDEEVSTPSTYV